MSDGPVEVNGNDCSRFIDSSKQDPRVIYFKIVNITDFRSSVTNTSYSLISSVLQQLFLFCWLHILKIPSAASDLSSNNKPDKENNDDYFNYYDKCLRYYTMYRSNYQKLAKSEECNQVSINTPAKLCLRRRNHNISLIDKVLLVTLVKVVSSTCKTNLNATFTVFLHAEETRIKC